MEFEMDNAEYQQLLATMYDDADEAAASQPSTTTAPNVGLRRTRIIKVGPIPYEVPTTDYVTYLEHHIQQQAKMLEHQQAQIARLETLIAKSKRSQVGHARQMDDLRRELSTKIGRRDTV
jgi:hypothetical protein